MVPDESDRKKTVIGADGRVTPLFSAAIAGSSHLVIVPRKICAISFGVSVSLLTPPTWNETATGPVTIGMSMAGDPHWVVAVAMSAALSAASEPAKSTLPDLKSVTPWPDPPPL